MATYKLRNLPCDVVPNDKLWYISGNGAHVGSGVLEWCVNKGDAEYLLQLMKLDPDFSNLEAKPYRGSSLESGHGL